MNDKCYFCSGKKLKDFSDNRYRRCSECGLIAMKDIPGTDQLSAHYNEIYYTKELDRVRQNKGCEDVSISIVTKAK